MILINAYKSIIRSIGRNVLIGIIVFTISLASCIALSIKSAANKAEATGLESATITGTINVDRDKIMESVNSNNSGDNVKDMRELMNEYTSLTLTQYEKYKESDYIKSTYYSSSITLNASGSLEPVSTSSESSSSTSNKARPGGSFNISGEGRREGMMAMGEFTVIGYSSEEAMTDFISGESKITAGEMFDVSADAYNVLISSDLATFNDLKVGDTIKLANPSKSSEKYKLTIVGIYTNASSTSNGNDMMFSTSMDPANQIIMSSNAVAKIVKKSKSNATKTTTNGTTTTTALSEAISYTYTFKNLEDYEDFASYLTAEGLSEYYTLSSSDISNYESSLIPLKNLSSFATTMLVLVLIVGGIILIVLNMFNIRERKYEVGVLTAIGIKKPKVAMQFVTELLAIALIAIVLGAAVGGGLSVPVSNKLLANQVAAQETTASNQEANFGRPGGDNNMPTVINRTGMFANQIEYLDEINATINLVVIGQLIGIGVILTTVSSLGAIIFVLRYEPLKILANRV